MTAHPKGKRVLVKHMLTAGISLMVLFCVALVPLFAASNATNTFDGVREIGQTIPGGTVSQAVGSTPIIIDQPGSYRLIGNVVATAGNAIELRSSNVTLDLNGFNVAAAGMGILSMGLSQLQRIVVINGTIDAQAGGVILPEVTDCRVEHVSVTSGPDGRGITGGSNCIVKSNTVSHSNIGILCTQGCMVIENTIASFGDAGIWAKVGSLVLGNRISGGAGVGLRLDDTTGYSNNVLRNNKGGDVSGGAQIGNNLCATSVKCQ